MEYRVLAASECEAAIALELAGYPADEAASLDSLQYRQKNVSHCLFFLKKIFLVDAIASGVNGAVLEVQGGL